jgi:hypothetical protein
MRGTGRDRRCHGNHVASRFDWRREGGPGAARHDRMRGEGGVVWDVQFVRTVGYSILYVGRSTATYWEEPDRRVTLTRRSTFPGRHNNNKRPTRTCSGRSQCAVTDFNNAKDGRKIDWIDLLFLQLPSQHGVAVDPSKPEPSACDLSDSGSPSGTDRLSTYNRGQGAWRGGDFPHIFQWSSSESQRTPVAGNLSRSDLHLGDDPPRWIQPGGTSLSSRGAADVTNDISEMADCRGIGYDRAACHAWLAE